MLHISTMLDQHFLEALIDRSEEAKLNDIALVDGVLHFLEQTVPDGVDSMECVVHPAIQLIQ
jgi:hypothetical protein